MSRFPDGFDIPTAFSAATKSVAVAIPLSIGGSPRMALALILISAALVAFATGRWYERYQKGRSRNAPSLIPPLFAHVMRKRRAA